MSSHSFVAQLPIASGLSFNQVPNEFSFVCNCMLTGFFCGNTSSACVCVINSTNRIVIAITIDVIVFAVMPFLLL